MAEEASKKVKSLNLKASNTDDNTVVATWTFSDDHLDCFKYEWKYYKDGGWYTESQSETKDRIVNYSWPNGTKKVKIRVKPVSKKHTVDKKEKSYWSGSFITSDEFVISEKAKPLRPDQPVIEITESGTRMRAKVANNEESSADYYWFELYNNNNDWIDDKCVKISKSKLETSVTFEYNAVDGKRYRTRVKGYIGDGPEDFEVEGPWSVWSEYIAGIPEKAEISDLTVINSNTVVVNWFSCAGATKYKIEYVADNKENFTRTPDAIGTWEVENGKAESAQITVNPGHTYFFRLASGNDNGWTGWSSIVSCIIGHVPNPPTTWTKKSSYKVGTNVRFYWTHNSVDGSVCSNSHLRLKYGSNDIILLLKNRYADDPDKKNDTLWFDVTLDSGQLSDGSVLKWYVRTMGVALSVLGDDDEDRKKISVYKPKDDKATDLSLSTLSSETKTSDSIVDFYGPWSAVREITMCYEPEIVLANDSDRVAFAKENGFNVSTVYGHGSNISAFPLVFMAYASPESVRVLQWYLQISANEPYEYIDYSGEIKMVQSGDIIYSKIIEPISRGSNKASWMAQILTPKDITLENSISYTVHIKVVGVSGLFSVKEWTVVPKFAERSINIALDTTFNPNNYTMDLYPSVSNNVACYLDVYRMNYDGSFEQIGDTCHSSSPSNLTDLFPSLKLAKYRVVATLESTGQQFYVDMQDDVEDKLGMVGIVIQWNMKWRTHLDSEYDNLDVPRVQGSKVELFFNIDTSEKVEKDVALVSYIGRENPVAYYGTQKKETISLKTDIPADDEALVYQLRRLSAYKGNCYIREPSGIGYWATVNVSMNRTHLETVIPVSIEVTRVEGEHNAGLD